MKTTCLAMVLFGIASLMLGLIWPHFDDGSSTWTEEKALAYREASSRSHAASTALSSRPPTEESRRLAEEAYAEFQALKAELDAARNRGSRTAFLLKVAGCVLAGVGGVAFLVVHEPA